MSNLNNYKVQYTIKKLGRDIEKETIIKAYNKKEAVMKFYEARRGIGQQKTKHIKVTFIKEDKNE